MSLIVDTTRSKKMLGPRNRLFYASTFIDNNAGGLQPPSAANMDTLVNAMSEACYGSVFQPDRCAVLSQMVGRIRTQDDKLKAVGTSGRVAAVGTTLAVTTDVGAGLSVTPSQLASALSVLGSSSAGTSTLALC
jgi:hypothetical protein